MKRICTLALAALLFACAPNPYGHPLPSSLHIERVQSWDNAIDPRSSRWAPWARVTEDPAFGPIWFAISDRGHACLVPREVFPLLYRGLELNCEWRFPRQQSGSERPASFRQGESITISNTEGTLFHFTLPPTVAHGIYTITVQAYSPGSSVVVVGDISFDCQGHRRLAETLYVVDAKTHETIGQETDKTKTWEAIPPHSVVSRMESHVCPIGA